jgi:hypothetical protein
LFGNLGAVIAGAGGAVLIGPRSGVGPGSGARAIRHDAGLRAVGSRSTGPRATGSGPVGARAIGTWLVGSRLAKSRCASSRPASSRPVSSGVDPGVNRAGPVGTGVGSRLTGTRLTSTRLLRCGDLGWRETLQQVVDQSVRTQHAVDDSPDVALPERSEYAVRADDVADQALGVGRFLHDARHIFGSLSDWIRQIFPGGVRDRGADDHEAARDECRVQRASDVPVHGSLPA